jgi:hypothetical protein
MSIDFNKIIPTIIDPLVSKGRLPTAQEFTKAIVKEGIKQKLPALASALRATRTMQPAKQVAKLLLNKVGYFVGDAASKIRQGR